jgi:hypothetical protein|tara:strand:+ start:134 stop:715 length:582 start_codon:yes stop_codon:yes gene_type:complete
MSAYLVSEDQLNALATLYGEFYKAPNYIDSQTALDRAYYFAPITKKLENWECENIARLLLKDASNTHKGLALHKVVFDHLLEANVESLQAAYPDCRDMWTNNYKFKKSSTIAKWVAEKDTKGLMQCWGMLKNWDYQSCEDFNYRDTAAFQMKGQIEYAILHLLEKKLCGDSAVWGSWEDPRLDEHVVCISDMF